MGRDCECQTTTNSRMTAQKNAGSDASATIPYDPTNKHVLQVIATLDQADELLARYLGPKHKIRLGISEMRAAYAERSQARAVHET